MDFAGPLGQPEQRRQRHDQVGGPRLTGLPPAAHPAGDRDRRDQARRDLGLAGIRAAGVVGVTAGIGVRRRLAVVGSRS